MIIDCKWLHVCVYSHQMIIRYMFCHLFCRARSLTSRTSSRPMASRLRWRPAPISTCSRSFSLLPPLRLVLAWRKRYRARIHSSWWALPSSAAPFSNWKLRTILKYYLLWAYGRIDFFSLDLDVRRLSEKILLKRSTVLIHVDLDLESLHVEKSALLQ